MCGIVGYIGSKNCSEILLDGLSRLEYRGYDSAGIALVSEDRILLRKQEGKLKELIKVFNKSPLAGTLGIAHTRWATHGIPSQKNAHPHLNCHRNIAIVHNGIVENYAMLKNKLLKEGHKFLSETDTEIIVHLIEKFYLQKKLPLEEAVRLTTLQLEGTYALGVVSTLEPEKLVGARRGSPLVLGIGEGENYLASDVPALLPYTKKVIFLEEGELAVLTKNSFAVYDSSRQQIKKTIHKIEWDVEAAAKSGYPHFMLKEIHEQPKAINDTLRERIIKKNKNYEVVFSDLKINKNVLNNVKKIFVVACGTAYYAGLTGRYFLEEILPVPCEVEIASEFRYRELPLPENSLTVVISQSGETADTLASLRKCKQAGMPILSIVNVMGSTIARESDGVLYTRAGPEIGVASTKAYTSQLTAFLLLAIYLSQLKNKNKSKLLQKLNNLQNEIKKVLKLEKQIIKIAKKYYEKTNFLYLGRGLNYPNSLEGALKLKEISYIHAEGYAAGEMKHGPIALIDKNLPVVCIAPKDKNYDKMISNIQEVVARNGQVIAIATEGDKEIKKFAKEIIYLPKIDDVLTPFLVVIPLQLLAYHIALLRGCDIDQPRNLAKSVTVE